MRKLLVYIVLSWIYTTLCVAHNNGLLDLEAHLSDFVLETKRIHIPGFEGAFNPCIVRWKNLLLMSFRVRDANMISTFEIGLVWLDEEYNPISEPFILNMHKESISTFSKYQDPRLFVFNGNLYMAYSNFITIDDTATRRMFVAQLQYEGGEFFITNHVCLHPFENYSSRWEKNWVPFVSNHQLLFAYSIHPHLIFKPSLATGACQTFCNTQSMIHWKWGELRGGTPALKDGNEYLAFFHSSIPMKTVQSNGEQMVHYVMGAYTFSAQYPFCITRISAEPIVGKNFFNGPAYNTWKPLRVVFPMGYVMDNDYIWISYGRQDFECWVAKLDKQKLYQSLIPCHKSIIAETITEIDIVDVQFEEIDYYDS